MALGVGLEAGQVNDGVFRHEALKLVRRRAHQQGADELVVPGEFVDDAYVDAVFRLRPTEQVGDVERVLFLQRGEEILLQRGEMLRLHRSVIVPPHRIFRLAIADDELVLGAATGVLAGFDHQRSVLGAAPFTVFERRSGQLARIEIGVDRGIGGDALIGKRVGKRSGH